MQKEKYIQAYKRVDLPKEEDYFHLECPSCKCETPSSDININDKIAKCSSCNAVFSFQASVDDFKERKDPLKKPAGVDKIYFGKELELSMNLPISVYDAIALSLAPFIGLLGGLSYFKDQSMIGLGFLIAMIFVFTFFIVRVIRQRKRKIYFVCQENNLIIERSNNRIIKDKVFRSQEIDQVYVTRTPNGYAIKAILNTPQGQVHKMIIDFLRTTIEAKYIEQEIEEYYGITNQRVSTEI